MKAYGKVLADVQRCVRETHRGVEVQAGEKSPTCAADGLAGDGLRQEGGEETRNPAHFHKPVCRNRGRAGSRYRKGPLDRDRGGRKEPEDPPSRTRDISSGARLFAGGPDRREGEVKTCHACGAEWRSATGQRPAKAETCTTCGADLHCCLNCDHYDPGAANQCRSRTAEPVLQKDRRNFCDEFRFAEDASAGRRGTGPSKDDMDRKWKDLFGG